MYLLTLLTEIFGRFLAEETVIINLDDADIEHLGLPRVSGDM